MNFRDALNTITAELTPQPWEHTTDDGTTLRVIPAGLRADKGTAEVNIRITRADATGLYDYGITGPDSRGVAEVGVPTSLLPALIDALTEQSCWTDSNLVAGRLRVTPADDVVFVDIWEDHGDGRTVAVSVVLPEAQRMPLASALARAMDVARSWEA
jgi:hypothetical protein